MDDGVAGLDDVESVEYDRSVFAVQVGVIRALREGSWDGKLWTIDYSSGISAENYPRGLKWVCNRMTHGPSLLGLVFGPPRNRTYHHDGRIIFRS